MAHFKLLEWESTPPTYYVTSLPSDSSIVSSIIDTASEWLTLAFFKAQSFLVYMLWSPFLFSLDAFLFAVHLFQWFHWLFQIMFLTWVYVSIARMYQGYLNLGKGGTPPDFLGWLRVTRLRAMGGLWSVFHPPEIPPMMHPYRGKLDFTKFPQRTGGRPQVGGVAPQRQLDQKTPASTFQNHLDMFRQVFDEQDNVIRIGPSFLEGATTAVFALQSQWTNNRPFTHQFGYEICHPHRNDGSLHMVLHPEDCATVIEKGWGERHPLARGSWYWRAYHATIRRIRTDQRPTRAPVPEYLCFIYAPRDEDEEKIIKELLYAAIWFATGVDYDNGKPTAEAENTVNLPAPPPLRPNQIPRVWDNMTEREKWNSDKLDYVSWKTDNFLGWFWKWICVRLGSIFVVIWLMELQTVIVQWLVYIFWSAVLFYTPFKKLL